MVVTTSAAYALCGFDRQSNFGCLRWYDTIPTNDHVNIVHVKEGRVVELVGKEGVDQLW